MAPLAGTLLAQESIGGHPSAYLTSQGAEGGGAGTLAVTSATRARDGGNGGGGPVGRALFEAFLPEGYPHSVSSDYLSYQVWDSIQGLSSYVRGMLSSQAMLAGVGVGSAAATPLGAVFQFFIKDFTGMLGGILFASSQGSGLDCYAKQWRLFADVMNDIGMALELASPLLPGAFLLMACLGSVARAVTGVAGGATRMALTQHFALQRNAADIAAKEGSQETAVTLVGMILGMGLIRLAAGWQLLVWTAFWALTALHVWANVRAMRCLRITSINQARLGLLLRHYLRTGEALTPDQLAAQESLVPPPLQRLLRRLGLGGLAAAGGPQVAVAPSLTRLGKPLQRQLAALLQQAAQAGSSRQYIAAAAHSALSAGPDAVVLLRQGAVAADVLAGYCAALMAAWNAEVQRGQGLSKLWPAGAQLALADVDAWLAGAATTAVPPPAGASSGKRGGSSGKSAASTKISAESCTAAGSYEAFLAALASAGWALDRVALMQGQARLAWGTDLRSD